jgi:hypothetical protein
MTPAANVPTILAEGLKARIGERSQEISEPVPAIYLFRTLEGAENALGGWFGGSFDEDTQLSLLAVDLYIDVPADDTRFEVAINADIAASAITVLCDDVDDVSDLKSLYAQMQAIGNCPPSGYDNESPAP